MRARLHELLDRPISDAQGARAFTIVAVLLVGAAAMLALDAAQPNRRPDATTTPAARVAPPSPTPSARTQVAPRPSTGSPASSAARQFLNGYLSLVYGRGSVRHIRRASSRLLHRLGRSRPRVSPATRARHARVVELRERRGQGRRWVRALIDDGGVARYGIELALARRHGRWIVVEVGDE